MKPIDVLHITINEKQISFRFFGLPLESDIATEEEVAYTVVKILHRVMNINLPDAQDIMDQRGFSALGKKLSSILFQGKIEQVLAKKFEYSIEDSNYKCRLILEFNDSNAAIIALPWEYLFFEPVGEQGEDICPENFLLQILIVALT